MDKDAISEAIWAVLLPVMLVMAAYVAVETMVGLGAHLSLWLR